MVKNKKKIFLSKIIFTQLTLLLCSYTGNAGDEAEQPLRIRMRSFNTAVKNAALIEAREIVRNGDYAANASIIHHLWVFGNKFSDKDLARPGMIAIAKELNHNYAWSAANCLWESKQDQEIARLEYRKIAQNPSHSHFYDAILKLWLDGNEEDRVIIRPSFRLFLEDQTHPKFWETLTRLWSGKNGHFRRNDFHLDREIIRPILKEIASNSGHPHFLDAAFQLWSKEATEEDKDSVRHIIRNIAAEPSHPKHREAVQKLTTLGNAEDNIFAYDTLRQIVDNPNVPNALNAAKLLLKNYDKNKYQDESYEILEADKNTAFERIKAIAGNPEDPDVWEAVTILSTGELIFDGVHLNFRGDKSVDNLAARPAIPGCFF